LRGNVESEKVVQGALDQLLNKNKDMTTIIIAHRLQTVKNADCIAVVHDGRVVEKGNHDELLRINGGFYCKLVKASSSDLDHLAP